MSNSIFNTLFLTFVLFSCAEEDQSITDTTFNNAFEINYNETINIEEGSVTVKFIDVVSDSRCAVDVECVWEGELTVKLAINNEGIEISNSATGVKNEVTIDQVKITFLNEQIKPIPYSNVKYSIDAYGILLKVEKI
jgi:hypothetical protein